VLSLLNVLPLLTVLLLLQMCYTDDAAPATVDTSTATVSVDDATAPAVTTATVE
jgi:hypothetical protein